MGGSADRLPPGAAIATFLLPFSLILYLSLQGGGYDTVIRGEIGILAWWGILLVAVAGLAAGRRLPRSAKWAVGLFGAFAIWTTLGMLWGESAGRAAEEAARVWGYLGVFAVALLLQGRASIRPTAAGVAAAIGVVGVLALLSRLHPQWFPTNEVAEFIPATASRISYPLDYWNGVAGLLAIGLPLLLWLAAEGRAIAARAIAAAAIPALALAIYFTLSRGGALEAAFGIAALIAIHPRRLRLAPSLALCGAGSLLLVVLAGSRDALEAGLMTEEAFTQGDEMLLATVLVCGAVAAGQALAAVAERRERLPRPAVPRRIAVRIAAGVGAVLVVAVVASGALGSLGDSFEEFKAPVDPGDSTARFESSSGNGRWQYWGRAADAGTAEPLVGIGPGSYEFWWAREPALPGTVRDAHSLYVETFGELGVPGLLLVVAAIGWVVGFGLRRALTAEGPRRAELAALVAAAATFAFGAGIDWLWELAVLPITFLLLAAAIVAGDLGAPRRRWSWKTTGAVAVVAVAGTLLCGLVVATNEGIRDSKQLAEAGQLDAALDRAEDAADYMPFAGEPRLQEALVLEGLGELDDAAAEARLAIDREPTNWRPYFVLSRIESQLGPSRVDAALEAFDQARSLNPSSSLFDDS